MLSKENRQSARIMGRVLNDPLYDGNCSRTARERLEAGDVDGAIAEWRRLADLGSGRARCILAYIALRGTASAAPDLEEARRLASSAVGVERGYANYVLAWIAIKEGQASIVARYLAESYKAGFTPAATELALIMLNPRASAKMQSEAESLLRKSAAAGHRPAKMLLCGAYLRGQWGFAKRFLGAALLPMAFIQMYWSFKYRVFSLGSFDYRPSAQPLFANQETSD